MSRLSLFATAALLAVAAAALIRPRAVRQPLAGQVRSSTGSAVRPSPRLILPGHENGVRALAFSPSGGLLASSGHDGAARLWDVATGRCVRTVKVDTGCVAFSPNGVWLLTGCRDRSTAPREYAVRFWNALTGRPTRTLGVAQTEVSSIAWSADGRLLAVADGGPVRVWEAGHWRQVAALEESFPNIGRGDSVGASQVRFSPDGRTLAVVSTASYEGVPGHMQSRVALWDTRTWKRRWTLPDDPTRWRAAVAFSPDGATLAIATAGTALEGDVFLWDVRSGRVRKLAHQAEGGYGIAFVNQGLWVAAGGDWAQVRLLEATSGRVMAILSHAATVAALAASARGGSLATDNGDGKILLWDVRALAAQAQGRS